MATANDRGGRTLVPGRCGVVGLGLIGGSFAKALHAGGHEVYACNRTRSTVEIALVETCDGVLDEEAAPTCELIVLASYARSSVEWLRAHADLLSPGAVVIDTCGTKAPVCEACFAIAEGRPWSFCGTHPMAGSQHSGFAHARADLFEGAPLVLCPPPMDDFARADMLGRLRELLACCGFGKMTITSPENHDRMIAYTSQLPHAIACAYVKSPTNRERVGFTGGSYRDLTRVAHMNAGMWCDLFLENADRLSEEIGSLVGSLEELRRAVEAGDAERLRGLLEEGDAIQRRQEGLS